jgi:glucoamylase
MLRPAVQREHRRRILGTAGGEVDPDAGGQVVKAMLDAVELRHGGRHEATRYDVARGQMRSIPLLLLMLALLAAPAAARTRADGAPGSRPTWTPADKQAFGTSSTRGSRVWFTLREREMTEVYFPDLATPSIRAMEFVVSRGGPEVAVDRETANGAGVVERLDGLNFRQTVTDTANRWRLVKTYTTDPFRSVVVVRVRFESLTGEPYRLHVLLDPQLDNDGRDDRARTIAGALVASDRRMASALAASPAFTATSSGYASTSDPWNDLRDDGSLDAGADARKRGNVRQAATTALDGVTRRELTLALGFGRTHVTARQAAAETLAAGFDPLAAENAAGWAAYRATLKPAPAAAAPVIDAYETSLLVLAAHDDKAHPGAGIASPTMPWAWGQLTVDKKDRRSAPYHLVWPRDLYQVATAEIAAGATQAAVNQLDFLLREAQRPDGHFPQNVQVDGRAKWTGIQMDEQALPIVLAWQLQRFDATTWRALRRTAEFILRHGPATEQDRWENESGYSPGTIAAEIAGLVCAADIARRNGAEADAARYERVADRWAGAVQRWTATSNGPYSDAPYYLRLTKDRRPDRGTRYSVGDGGPKRADQRKVVDPSFLELVRLGVKRFDDPVIVNTLAVVDRLLGRATPNGTFWHRYVYDGYGERSNGAGWLVTKEGSRQTFGRLWPIFAGERGEYELLAGRPAGAYLKSIADAGNGGGMIPEQVWDGRAPTRMPAGEGTFSATPLAWSHAQLIRLAWSIEAGAPVEQPAIVACRYVRQCP